MNVETALAVLEDVLKRCRTEDMRTAEVFAALDFLSAQTAREWPFRHFRQALDRPGFADDFRAEGRWQEINASLGTIKLAIEARKFEPKTLAYKLAEEGTCPLPFTHDRLQESHYWWHEMARNYHEPDPFRFSLGAFIQASRSVTFMLKKEKRRFKDFTWYEKWKEQAKNDTVLRWLQQTRNGFVHQQALEPNSWLETHCVGNPRQPHGPDEETPHRFSVSPFQCTHYYIALGSVEIDHSHEFIRYWGIDTLPNRELLEACAEVYDHLDALVDDAHRRLGASMRSLKVGDSPRALPCMADTMKHRVVRTIVRDGREEWVDEPPALHVS